MFTLREKTLYSTDVDLWIDSMRPRTRSYVSHGHADHARPHDVVISTPATAAICASRFARRRPEAGDPENCVFETHEYGSPWRLGDAQLTLFSAGHVLGSSQLLIENEAGRFVYTGDFKMQQSFSVEPIDVPRCDTLLMECTYGKPQFVFPSREEIAAEMVAFARQALEDGITPIFYAYSLGKAQEAMAILGQAGLPLTVHGAIAGMSDIYVEHGIPLPPYLRYDAERFEVETVVIWPPSNGTVPKAFRDTGARTAALTGWALAGGTARTRTDAAFALSDHADFPSLIQYVELAQPRTIVLNHGFRDCVQHFRKLGIEAEFIDANPQLSLF